MKIALRLITIILSVYLGIHSGQLALLQTGHEYPLEVYPIPARMLPDSDRQALKNGIPVQNRLHLAQLLEDYLS